MFFVLGLLLIAFAIFIAIGLGQHYKKVADAPPRARYVMVTSFIVGVLFIIYSILALLWRIMP